MLAPWSRNAPAHAARCCERRRDSRPLEQHYRPAASLACSARHSAPSGRGPLSSGRSYSACHASRSEQYAATRYGEDALVSTSSSWRIGNRAGATVAAARIISCDSPRAPATNPAGNPGKWRASRRAGLNFDVRYEEHRSRTVLGPPIAIRYSAYTSHRTNPRSQDSSDVRAGLRHSVKNEFEYEYECMRDGPSTNVLAHFRSAPSGTHSRLGRVTLEPLRTRDPIDRIPSPLRKWWAGPRRQGHPSGKGR